MNRSVFLFAAAFFCTVAFAPLAVAQTAAATPATPSTTAAAPARAKFVPLVKGIASIELIQGASKRVGPDIVTVLKVKNTSTGAIGLLRIFVWQSVAGSYGAHWVLLATPPFRTRRPDTACGRQPRWCAFRNHRAAG